jgi:hypothetical protein
MNTATDRPWYTVIAATVLALGFGAAAFWLLAFTSVDQGVAFAFLSPALLIVGYITGQAVPGAVSSVLNRASVAPPAEQPLAPDFVHPADAAFMADRRAQFAQVDAQRLGAAQPTPPAS